MADALCGPSNALQTFQKHTSVDRTLQQDRTSSRQLQAESFRSPQENAGILDAEFEAFHAGQPLLIPQPERDLFQRSAPFVRRDNSNHAPSWAKDFQNLHLDGRSYSRVPSSQFSQHAPLHRNTASGLWHHEFSRQNGQLSSTYAGRQGTEPTKFSAKHQSRINQNLENQSQQGLLSQQLSSTDWKHEYVSPRTSASLLTPSSMENIGLSNMQVDQYEDQAAFEKAFEAHSSEWPQPEVYDSQTKDVSAGVLNDSRTENQVSWLPPERDGLIQQHRIGSDKILDEAEERQADEKNVDEADELARTAGQLLQNVSGDQSQKFQRSNFLSLMRQLRDKQVRVEGDNFVDVTQPLHPGGENYPGRIS